MQNFVLLLNFRSQVGVVQYNRCALVFRNVIFMFYFIGSLPAVTPYTGQVPIWLRTRLAKPSLAIRTSVNCPKWMQCVAGCINCINCSSGGFYYIGVRDVQFSNSSLFPFLAMQQFIIAVFSLCASDPQQYKLRKNIFLFNHNVILILYIIKLLSLSLLLLLANIIIIILL